MNFSDTSQYLTYTTTSSWLPSLLFLTITCWSIQSLRLSTCEIMPMSVLELESSKKTYKGRADISLKEVSLKTYRSNLCRHEQ